VFPPHTKPTLPLLLVVIVVVVAVVVVLVVVVVVEVVVVVVVVVVAVAVVVVAVDSNIHITFFPFYVYATQWAKCLQSPLLSQSFHCLVIYSVTVSCLPVPS